MSLKRGTVALAAIWLVIGAAGTLPAQYSSLSSPFNSVGDSFFENIGGGFSFNFGRGGFNGGDDFGRGGVVGFGGGGFGGPLNAGWGPSAGPPVGGGGPGGGGAQFGFGFGGSGFGGSLNFNASQGSNRSLSSVTPSITVPNGGTGHIFSGEVRPFVTGLVPVVGDFSHLPHALGPAASGPSAVQQALGRLESGNLPPTPSRAPATTQPQNKVEAQLHASRGSSAGRGALSVTEIRRQQALEDEAQQQEAELFVERARAAEAAGKPGAAKVFYRQAASRATGELKEQLLEKVRQLDRK